MHIQVVKAQLFYLSLWLQMLLFENHRNTFIFSRKLSPDWGMTWHSYWRTCSVWSVRVFMVHLSTHLFVWLQIFLAQIKYPGADMDITLSAPSWCRQISPEEFEYQRAYGSQEPLAALLEEVISDAKLSNKEKRKKLKQVLWLLSIWHPLTSLLLCYVVFYFNRFLLNLF